MKYIVSRYNHNIDWLKDYTEDYVLYDRSEKPIKDSIIAPNVGSDIYDKFTYIIDNYDNLPSVAVYTKANLFKYIPREEFDEIKDNKTYTPILSKGHKTTEGVSFYKDGMYNEINNYWYLAPHPAKREAELIDFLGMRGREYNTFAPGSNYILPKENILQHPKKYYKKLISFLDWTAYPGEAQIIERNLHNIWSTM